MRVSNKIGGQLVAIECSPDTNEQASWLLAHMQMMVKRGLSLREGGTIGFGWVTLTLKRTAEGLLLHEPDFSVIPPIGLRPDVTCSFQVQGQMLSVARSAGAQPVFSTYRQWVVVGAEAWDARGVMMSRMRTPTKDDSGWLVLRKDSEQSKRMEKVEVCEILKRRPSWLMALALPVGSIVELNGDQIVAVGGS